MPVTQEEVLHIVCDNAACPGNDLPANDRLGWTFINAEVYGEQTQQFVYCCAECAGTVSTKLSEAPEAEPQPA